MENKVRPINDWLMVKLEPVERVLPSGIIIPDTHRDETGWGTVTDMGAGEVVNGKRVAMDLKVGDRVCFQKFIGKDVPGDMGKEHRLLKYYQILAVEEAEAC